MSLFPFGFVDTLEPILLDFNLCRLKCLVSEVINLFNWQKLCKYQLESISKRKKRTNHNDIPCATESVWHDTQNALTVKLKQDEEVNDL